MYHVCPVEPGCFSLVCVVHGLRNAALDQDSRICTARSTWLLFSGDFLAVSMHLCYQPSFPGSLSPVSPGFDLLPAVIVFLTLSSPLFLRLHCDLATLPMVHINAGSWSPQIPACGSGTVVPRVKRQRTVEPDPENRWDPGKHGPGASAGLYDTSYTLCCLPNPHPLAVWQALCQALSRLLLKKPSEVSFVISTCQLKKLNLKKPNLS